MAWRAHGRAEVDPSSPAAVAICDRCGFLYNRRDLATQHDWAGTTLVSQNILVCTRCLDEPQPQLRAITLPPDPPPVWNPRADSPVIDERWDDADEVRITEDGSVRVKDNTDEVP